MLTEGSKAPDFTLPDADMKQVSLADFAGKNVLMYFYPKDDTPGCTVQATDFTDLSDEFEAAGVVVIGISRDNCFSHQAFRDKFGLSVTLLADVDGDMSDHYGVWQEKERGGVKKMGTVRSTFVIDGAGVIRYAEYGVVPKGHAKQMLEFVQNLD